MTGAIAIFVKTPGYSAVKSRLAVQRGEAYAVNWYQRAAAAVASVVRVAKEERGVTAYWAVAEPEAHDSWLGLPTVTQGEGSLGARMAQVHADLVTRHGFSTLLGADAPQLTSDLLCAAVDWLSESAPRLVLGPALDGGFWLFGANIVPPSTRWTAVHYSVADTAREFQRSMQGMGEWRTLPALTDADHAGDLVLVQQALLTLPDPTPEQRALAAWMCEQEAKPS